MPVAQKKIGIALVIGVLLVGIYSRSSPTFGEAVQHVDITDLFATAERDGRVGLARKSKIVDVRPAEPGEIFVTVIKGEGKETQSPPARLGDFVVRNRCPETGNEEVSVQSEKFAGRYQGPIGPEDRDGWRPYRPRGVQMRYFIVRPEDGRFTFTAPWGESMVARPKDAIVRSLTDPKDLYRIAAAAFDCTYEIVEKPRSN